MFQELTTKSWSL